MHDNDEKQPFFKKKKGSKLDMVMLLLRIG